ADEPRKLTPCSWRRLCASGRAALLVWATTPIQTATASATITRKARTTHDVRSQSLGNSKQIVRARQRRLRGLELGGRQPDVRVAPEAAREHAGRLDRRRVGESRHRQQRPQGEAPLPPLAARVVLRAADNLDDGEDVLPAGRVADGEIALLDARAAGREMGAEPARVDLVGEEPSGRPANEKPVLHRGFLTRRKYARQIRAGALLL